MRSQRALQKSNRWTCRRKLRFLSEAQATLAAEVEHQRHYRCSACGAWHLTSKPA